MLFVSLLSPEGKGKEAIAYLKKLKAPRGITVHDVYVTFGSYDAVVVFEAPDPKKAMSFAVDIGIETGYLIETLGAVPAKKIWAIQCFSDDWVSPANGFRGGEYEREKGEETKGAAEEK